MTSLSTLARNAARPGYATTMLDKVVTRVVDRPNARHAAEARAWAADRAEPAAAFAERVDPGRWAEAERFAEALAARATELLAPLRASGVVLGGGGDYGLLYFLVRTLSPRTVVETGVAAGYSSQAILAALHAEGAGGELWSSDFPYFRIAEPERYVGLLVEPELRSNWHLLLRGDRANLRQILAEAPRIDLVHYDSDKSHRGRRRAMAQIEPRLAISGHVVMDDIDDNLWFAEHVARTGAPHRVFAFGNKYLGLIGELAEA